MFEWGPHPSGRFVNRLVQARAIEYATLVRGTDLAPAGEYPPWLEKLDLKLKNRMAEYKTRLGVSC